MQVNILEQLQDDNKYYGDLIKPWLLVRCEKIPNSDCLDVRLEKC